MTLNEYQNNAIRTHNYALSLEDAFLNGVLGLNGEAGELSNMLKKVKFQGHDYDFDHAVKELGDCLWYIAEAALGLGMTLDRIAEMNIEKLQKRYPNGFDPQRSMHREEGDV